MELRESHLRYLLVIYELGQVKRGYSGHCESAGLLQGICNQYDVQSDGDGPAGPGAVRENLFDGQGIPFGKGLVPLCKRNQPTAPGSGIGYDSRGLQESGTHDRAESAGILPQ